MKPANRNMCRMIAAGLTLGVCSAQAPATEEPLPTFGVTVVAPFGFCGRIYELPEDRSQEMALSGPLVVPPKAGPGGTPLADPGNVGTSTSCTTRLPEFQRLQPIGNIYTTQLNVPTRDFREGFPGVTGRFEWFAIDYTARFWIEEPGKYSFLLVSDDGSALYIDERLIINNDCMHAPLSASGSARLQGGIHDMRVSYFQGPRFQVALQLYIGAPGKKLHIFDTNEFRPPPNPADWKYPNPGNLDAPSDPCKAERSPKKLIPRPSSR